MTQNLTARFHELHRTPAAPLVLANCWDVVTARLVEEAGAAALATTSAAVAWAHGRADGNVLERDLMLANLRRITESVSIPVSCDIEGGFGDGDEPLAETARLVIEAGAVGVNLEDSTGAGTLREPREAAYRVALVRAAADRAGVDLFINARTDTFLSGPGDLQETLERARTYLDAGASGVFVPGTGDLSVITELADGIPAPLNILVGPGAPSVPELAAAGVRRVSVGSSLAGAVFGHVDRAARELLTDGTYGELAGARSWAELNGLMP